MKEKFTPMKYSLGEEVQFKVNTLILSGVIYVADFGGAVGQDYHSYDIFVEKENCLHKHVPEKNISKILRKADKR